MNFPLKEEIADRQNKNQESARDIQHLFDFSSDYPSMNQKTRMVERAYNSLKAGETHYVEVPGILSLREKIAQQLKAEQSVSITSSNVLVTTGVRESRFLAIQVFADLFDGTAFSSSVDPNVRQIVNVRTTNTLELGYHIDTFQIQVDEIIRAIQSGFKLIYIENPSKLSGKMLENGQIAEICSVLSRLDAHLIIDISLLPWVSNKDYFVNALFNCLERVIVIGDAFSGIAAKGLNVGFIATNKEWIDKITVYKQVLSICTSAPTQHAALEAGEIFSENYENIFSALSSAKSKIIRSLMNKGIKVVKNDSVNLITFIDPEQKIFEEFRNNNILLLSGRKFGIDNVSRLSVSLHDEQNKRMLSVLDRMKI